MLVLCVVSSSLVITGASRAVGRVLLGYTVKRLLLARTVLTCVIVRLSTVVCCAVLTGRCVLVGLATVSLLTLSPSCVLLLSSISDYVPSAARLR